ncbi:MAG: 7,8-didemethyl-8-hydroxy-5-deazariboflavin synthase subunit CofG [Candidatus Hodarchaeales archaeon]
MSNEQEIEPKNLSVKKLVEFLNTDDRAEIDRWKISARTIFETYYKRKLSYTTNIFIPLTRLCRNKCSYCGFSRNKVKKGSEYFSIKEVQLYLEQAKQYDVSEILITLGEKPELKYQVAKKWLKKHHFETTIDYVEYVAVKCLKEGLLPHVNAGTLKYDQLKNLKEITASMGMMLENISTRLSKKGKPHFLSPDKHPKERLTTLKNAGKLKIPFTTGILIGIEENINEILASLFSIRNLHRKYNHIQEVIIQNFQPQKNTPMEGSSPPPLSLIEKVVIAARHILQPEISIQVPPNLIYSSEEVFIRAGISDWGGISPITPDFINPEYKWPEIEYLIKISRNCGYFIQERLPIYPRYVKNGWLTEKIQNVIAQNDLVTEDGYRKRMKK